MIKGIIKFLKSELEFSIIITLLYFVVVLQRVLRFPLYLNNVVVLLCFVLLLGRLKSFRSEKYFFCLVVYLLTCIVATYKFNSSYKFFDTYFWEEFMFGLMISTYFMFPHSNYFSSQKKKFSLIEWLIIPVVIVINILVLLLQTSPVGVIIEQHNILGALNMVGIMAIYSKYCAQHLNKNKVLLLFVGLFFLVMLIYSNSRASLLATIFLFFLLLVNLFKKANVRKKKSVVNCGLCILAISVLVCFVLREKIVLFVFRDTDFSSLSLVQIINKISSNRWFIWTEQVPAALKGNLIFGNGIDTLWLVTLQRQLYLNVPIDPVSFCHNFVVDALYSSGIFGFIFFTCFFVYGFKYCKNVLKKNISTVIIICVFLLYFSLDTYFIWERYIPNMYFLMNVGLLINEVSYGKE